MVKNVTAIPHSCASFSLSYFSIVLIRHHGRGNVLKKGLVCGVRFLRDKSPLPDSVAAASQAETEAMNSHLKTHRESRKGGRERRRKGRGDRDSDSGYLKVA